MGSSLCVASCGSIHVRSITWPPLLLYGHVVSACALPPNVLKLHKQQASRSRSRPLMATPKPSLLLKTDPRSINPSPSTYFCVFFLFSSGSYWKSSVWVLVCSVWTVVVCQSGRPGQLLSAPITSLGRVCVTVHPLLASVHQAWLCSSGVYLHTAGSQTVAEVPTGVLVGFSDRSSRKWVKVKLQ